MHGRSDCLEDTQSHLQPFLHEENAPATRSMVSQIRSQVRFSRSVLFLLPLENIVNHVLNGLDVDKGKSFYVDFLDIFNIFPVFFRNHDSVDAGSLGC